MSTPASASTTGSTYTLSSAADGAVSFVVASDGTTKVTLEYVAAVTTARVPPTST